jgi:hypothetical protein
VYRDNWYVSAKLHVQHVITTVGCRATINGNCCATIFLLTVTVITGHQCYNLTVTLVDNSCRSNNEYTPYTVYSNGNKVTVRVKQTVQGLECIPLLLVDYSLFSIPPDPVLESFRFLFTVTVKVIFVEYNSRCWLFLFERPRSESVPLLDFCLFLLIKPERSRERARKETRFSLSQHMVATFAVVSLLFCQEYACFGACGRC